MSALNSGAFVTVVQIFFRRNASGLIRAQPVVEGVFVLRFEQNVYCSRTASPSPVFVTAKDHSTPAVRIICSGFWANSYANMPVRFTN